MPNHVCEYCNSKFTKSSNLVKHQLNAKYCKALQPESGIKCEYCKKVLSRADSLQRHYIKCLDYLVYQRVKVLEKEISILKEQLEERDRQIWTLTNQEEQ